MLFFAERFTPTLRVDDRTAWRLLRLDEPVALLFFAERFTPTLRACDRIVFSAERFTPTLRAADRTAGQFAALQKNWWHGCQQG